MPSLSHFRILYEADIYKFAVNKLTSPRIVQPLSYLVRELTSLRVDWPQTVQYAP